MDTNALEEAKRVAELIVTRKRWRMQSSQA